MTRICLFGAGAIGGYVGARLALKGEADVSLVARGAHLQAMRANGLALKEKGETKTVRPRLAENARELGPQDFVILTLKAHAIAPAIEALLPLIGPDTSILYAQNGLPWWYFHGFGGAHEGRRLASVDPGGAIWSKLGPERAIGSVVWLAAELEAPGIVAHNYGDRMPIGEPTGEKTTRAMLLSRLLTEAGLKSPVRPNLRNEIWLKLWGNLSFNPVSTLTGGTLGELATDPGTRRVIAAMMVESQAVAEAFGVTFAVGIDERIDMALKVGDHRTSMLQDVEAGRPTELEALLGSVIELAAIAGLETPALKMIYDLAKFRGRTAGH
ncbi:MAG: 2-dehydropantoate 2-reductase [Alphaproteobacteria bacterium]|nr:2-dehydropantoate 2-reductase [Alphaproteobacteria bacterium]